MFGRATIRLGIGPHSSIFILFLSSFFFFFPRLISAVGDWMFTIGYFGTWCGLSANLECRPEMHCTRLAANTGRKKIAISAPSHNFVGPYLPNYGMTCIDNR